MIGETIFGEGLVPLSLAKTVVYAMWYSAWLWLPVRGVAALIDLERYHARVARFYNHSQARLRPDSYRIGMNIPPPI